MLQIRLSQFLIFASFLLCTNISLAQSDSKDASDEKYKDIRTLLHILNVGPAMRQSLIDQIDQERALKDSEVPPEFWDEFEKEAISSVPEFIERLIPAYDGQFTHAEIKNLIKIHQDPVMVKFSRAETALTEASSKAGEAWGEELGKRVAARMTGEPESQKASQKPAKK